MTPAEIEKRIKKLVADINAAQADFIDSIDRPLGTTTAGHAAALRRKIAAFERQLTATVDKYRDDTLPQIYNDAVDEIYRDFTTRELPMRPPGDFAALHGEKKALLARELTQYTGQAIATVGRNVQRYLAITANSKKDDILRFKGLEAIQAKIRDAKTIGKTQKLLVENLKKEGFDSIVYGAGAGSRKMPVGPYAAMVARSTSREAGNAAREEQLTANGYDLVQLTEHHPTCRLCAILQGRVFSISGNDKRFPPLKTAFPDGYHNIHPNCRHSAVAYIEDFRDPDEIADDIKRSNESLDTDPRDPAERALYDKQQADNRRAREARRKRELKKDEKAANANETAQKPRLNRQGMNP